MKSAGRTTSIARKIAWRFQWGKLWRILWQTAALFFICTAVWCVGAEMGARGDLGLGWSQRSIQFNDFLDKFFIFPSNILVQLTGTDAFAGTVLYRIGEQTVEMGLFFFWLTFTLLSLTALRLGWWLFSCLWATRRIRKYLRPIDDIAQVTESISSHGFDEGKFHSLEAAIDHLGVASPDEQLHIGDDDLTGLETAVNNLIARMHAGYRQQVRFVDDASHELRTPIAVIQGYADMLARWGSTDEKVLNESIRAIQNETAHMKTLVDQLLFLARGDAGRQKLTLETLDLAALVREVWEESRMIDGLHEYALEAPLPVPFRGDEALLKQAVRILVDNACKYSSVYTRITLRAYRDGRLACIDVQDNGMGIDPDDAPRIFDRFFRSDAARKSDDKGSGLGLSIARWIVDRHGGRFQVRSYAGVGTRMTILLPPGPDPEGGLKKS